MKISKLIGRSQWWLSAIERGKIGISESPATKILLAIHSAGQRAQSLALPAVELDKFNLGPRLHARYFKNLKFAKRVGASR